MITHKITYWIMRSKSSECYHVRRKTKKEVLATLGDEYEKEEYDAPEKVTIGYTSLIDLLNVVLGEGGESTAIAMTELKG